MMIDYIKQTPSELSKQSRDYQVIARLFTAVSNISKMYIDDMNVWDNDIDDQFINLRSRTLNFIPKRIWTSSDLEAITSCFKYLMRNKGTKKAFEYCLNILMKVKKIKRVNVSIDMVRFKNNCLYFTIEENILSSGIVEDLISYLIPAGLIYRIIPYRAIDLDDMSSEIDVGISNIFHNEIDIEDANIYIGDDNSPELRDKTLAGINDSTNYVSGTMFNTYVYDDNINKENVND